MKLSLFSLAVVLSAGLVAAAPSPEAKKSKYNEPPPPPPRSAQSVSQTCSASQSSVKCCNQASSVGSKGHKVYYGENTFDLQCSQIVCKYSDNRVLAFLLSFQMHSCSPSSSSRE